MVSALGIFILFLFLGYLLGSLSSAVLVCRVMKLPDPRTQGSNNPGATNVMRIGGKKAAYLTFLGDFLKGLLPVLFAKWLSVNEWAIAGAALGAFTGHLYPLYFQFKGGKGIATLVGVLLAINPLLVVMFGLSWLIILKVSGYVSLASLIAATLTTLFSFIAGFSHLISGLLIILNLLIFLRHHENIKKLLAGKENHFKQRKGQNNDESTGST